LPDGIIIQIWVNFGGSCNKRCLYIIWPFGLFYGHVVNFIDIWYICPRFCIFSSVLLCCTKKILATLIWTVVSRQFWRDDIAMLILMGHFGVPYAFNCTHWLCKIYLRRR
jgi:hypothetical protein